MKFSNTHTHKPILAIGDVHGHLDRLEALLLQEGILGTCPDCGGSGDDSSDLCRRCDGDGICRVNFDVVVVQLGDLGHFGSSWTKTGQVIPGSASGDLLCYQYGRKWFDFVLWGNHDRAVVDQYHLFNGYIPPPIETKDIMQCLRNEERLLLAYAAHGFLMTHAGLHAQFKYNDVPEGTKTDPVKFAEWINGCSEKFDRNPVVDAIPASRAGLSNYGGILWRDASEKLFKPFRQVFGHSSKPKVRRYESKGVGISYCIDIGDRDNGRLAGIWLPDERIAEVHLTKP